MNTREMAEGYRMTHWSETMRERQELGMSIKAYCAQQGMHENVYYYWQRKLRETACRELASKQPAADLVPRGWTQLSAAESVHDNMSVTIKINDYRIEVGAGTDSELLAKVCQILKAL